MKKHPNDSKALMRKARKTNKSRDEIDRKNGNAAPSDMDSAGLLRTAMCAINYGIKSGDWDGVAEGQAMLEDLHLHLTNQEYKLD